MPTPQDMLSESKHILYQNVMTNNCVDCKIPNCADLSAQFLAEPKKCCQGKLRRKYLKLIEESLTNIYNKVKE